MRLEDDGRAALLIFSKCTIVWPMSGRRLSSCLWDCDLLTSLSTHSRVCWRVAHLKFSSIHYGLHRIFILIISPELHDTPRPSLEACKRHQYKKQPELAFLNCDLSLKSILGDFDYISALLILRVGKLEYLLSARIFTMLDIKSTVKPRYKLEPN